MPTSLYQDTFDFNPAVLKAVTANSSGSTRSSNMGTDAHHAPASYTNRTLNNHHMKTSKRQQRKINAGRQGQKSRPNRRAEKRLSIAFGAYEIAQKAPGTSGERIRKAARKPGANATW